jgi:hypothetical protein
MNTLITTISMLAVVVGITGIVPQLVTMLKTRSAAGQSPLGWSLALTANLGLAFVNGFGYQAPVLAAGNVLSLTGCLTAVWLACRFRHDDVERPVTDAVSDMRTQELVALREAVLAEQHRRTAELRAAA